MSRAKRGGNCLKPGKIGRVNCIRQQIMMPGEVMDISLDGHVRMESLRERDVMRINAHLAVFMTPLRWLWSEYPQYMKQGPDTGLSPVLHIPADNDLSRYGIGTYMTSSSKSIMRFWAEAYLRVYNEWYKHPEEADISNLDYDVNGLPAVPLQATWNQGRETDPDDTDDYTLASAVEFDVRDLAKKQARYRSAMKRDVLSFNRWMEYIKETYNGDGSREVDQVPIMLDQVEVGVNPRDIPASDGASMGQWQSLYDFNVSHRIPKVVAPEHCIITYMLTVRFPPITESHMPLAKSQNWEILTADPEYLSSMEPQGVKLSDILATNSTGTLGQMPAGWQWRCGHDVIGKQVYDRESFPYMRQPTSLSEARDATRIKPAFRSQALGDYMADIYIHENSRQPIGTAMDSYFSGMLDHAIGQSQSNDEFPKGGKKL